MSRHRSTLICVVVASLLLLAGCEPADSGYTGTILADEITLSVPRLPTPAVRLDDTTAENPRQTVRSVVVATTSMGARSRIDSVTVRAGDEVEAGQVVAIVAPGLPDAEITAREADARAARARVDVIESRLDDVADNRGTVRESRAEVTAAIAELTRTRADLKAKLADAKAALAAIEAMTPPPGSLPPTMTPPPGMPDPAALKGAVAQLEAGIAKVDAGLAKARAGLRKLDSASATLSDAKSALENGRVLARAGVDALDAATEVARAQRELAVVRAPSAGTVVWAARPGAVLAPGAPLATIRTLGPRRVRTWLPVEAADSVQPGAAARVELDSMAEPFSATVTLVGVSADFPPTTLATREIHMTRAVPVEVTLDTDVALPPGTPADLFITTR